MAKSMERALAIGSRIPDFEVFATLFQRIIALGEYQHIAVVDCAHAFCRLDIRPSFYPSPVIACLAS